MSSLEIHDGDSHSRFVSVTSRRCCEDDAVARSFSFVVPRSPFAVALCLIRDVRIGSSACLSETFGVRGISLWLLGTLFALSCLFLDVSVIMRDS